MRRRRLAHTGLTVSAVGFGASPLGAVYGRLAEHDGIDAVHTALDLGVTFFDVAPYYGDGLAERVLGKALHGIDREQYVLATKVGRYGDAAFDFSAARVRRSVEESIGRLGSGHIDLIQCHDIEFGDLDQIVHETVPALRDLQQAGLVRAVGITGYPLAALAHVARRVPVDTVMSYSHYTLQDRRLAQWLTAFTEAGAAVLDAAPLAMGALTQQGPPSWHPAPAEVLERCAAAAAVCRTHGADIARLALQFSLTTGPFASTVVGASSAGQIREAVESLDRPCDAALLGQIEECLAPVRDTGWVNGRPENQRPGGRP